MVVTLLLLLRLDKFVIPDTELLFPSSDERFVSFSNGNRRKIESVSYFSVRMTLEVVGYRKQLIQISVGNNKNQN